MVGAPESDFVRDIAFRQMDGLAFHPRESTAFGSLVPATAGTSR